MHILVLHSDVPPDAPPEDLDTLVQAEAVGTALRARGHRVSSAAFRPDCDNLSALLKTDPPDLVFNLVEGVDGKGRLAHLAPQMLDVLHMPYTGCSARAISITTDKPDTKLALRAASLPTPDWSEPPQWAGLAPECLYIVKSALEDASIGLDDKCIVRGADVPARATAMENRFGGAWFAERYIDGREFNIAVLEEKGEPRVLPLAEMIFEKWPSDKPRIVGYTAKWHEESLDANQTVRKFGIEESEPELASRLSALAATAWKLFNLSGYARVDLRVDESGRPLILEINANPCISPDAGLPAAAQRAGIDYETLVARIVSAVKLGIDCQ